MSKTNKIALTAATMLLASGALAELPQSDDNIHMGVATCAASQCHGSAVPRDGSNVLQNEYVTWTQDDPHSRAFEVLNNAQSRNIAARLGLPSASTAKICLDCHADNVAPAKRGERFHLADGVGCEACHGGAENWLASHSNSSAVTSEENRIAGLYATANPVKRGELCLSCHLGTRDKYASHKIMAAGHPRLAFELDTFTELWRTAGRQPHYRIDADYRDRNGAVNHSYTWAAGLLVDSRQRLQLVGSPLFKGDGVFPELGFYDCHSCHRSMKTVQWQALPRHGDVGPGAPLLHDGTLLLSLALARVLSPPISEALNSGMIALHRAGSRSPDAIRTAAEELDSSLAQLQSLLSPERLKDRETVLLREILASGAAGDYMNYISAEQAFMAVQMLVIEISDPDLEGKLDLVADTLNNDERYRPAQFAAMLATLSEPQADTDSTDD